MPLPCLLLLFTGCSGSVGDGNTVNRVFIESTANQVTAFECFFTSLRAIAVFDDGTQENVTFRGRWSSNNNAQVRVSNGSESTPRGVLNKGVISPVGTDSNGAVVASISFEFLGFTDNVGIVIDRSSLDINPRRSDILTPGTSRVLSAVAGFGAVDETPGLSVVNALRLVQWSIEPPAGQQAAATVDDFGVVRVLSPDEIAADNILAADAQQTLTITANTGMTGCAVGGEITAEVTVQNSTFTELEYRDGEGVNVQPATLVLPESVTRLLSTFAVYDESGPNELFQNVTGQAFLTSGDTTLVAAGLFGASFSTLDVSTAGIAQLTSTFDQGAGEIDNTAAPLNVDVRITGLSGPLTFSREPDPAPSDTATPPADLTSGDHMLTGSTLPLILTGDYTDPDVGMGIDLSFNASLAADDEGVFPGSSTASQISLLGDALEDNSVDFQSVVFTATRIDPVLLSADPGNPSAAEVTADLTIEVVDNLQLPQVGGITVDCDATNAGTDTVTVGNTLNCTAQAAYNLQGGGPATQNITSVVTWSVDDLNVASVNNLVGSIGELTGISAGTVTVTASFIRRDDTVATGSTMVTVNP